MKENKGITLVALIITIIVMLILVGVTISAVVNSDIIGQGEQAGNAYKEKQAEEQSLNPTYDNKTVKDYLDKVQTSTKGDTEEFVFTTTTMSDFKLKNGIDLSNLDFELFDESCEFDDSSTIHLYNNNIQDEEHDVMIYYCPDDEDPCIKIEAYTDSYYYMLNDKKWKRDIGDKENVWEDVDVGEIVFNNYNLDEEYTAEDVNLINQYFSQIFEYV